MHQIFKENQKCYKNTYKLSRTSKTHTSKFSRTPATFQEEERVVQKHIQFSRKYDENGSNFLGDLSQNLCKNAYDFPGDHTQTTDNCKISSSDAFAIVSPIILFRLGSCPYS